MTSLLFHVNFDYCFWITVRYLLVYIWSFLEMVRMSWLTSFCFMHVIISENTLKSFIVPFCCFLNHHFPFSLSLPWDQYKLEKLDYISVILRFQEIFITLWFKFLFKLFVEYIIKKKRRMQEKEIDLHIIR